MKGPNGSKGQEHETRVPVCFVNPPAANKNQ
jgi:hypothetical protein